MTNEKLFTAIWIPFIPFVSNELKPKQAKKYGFELLMKNRLSENVFHFVHRKNEQTIHSYYLIADSDEHHGRYLFVENNDLYHDYVHQFWGGGDQYSEANMYVYLDVMNEEDIKIKLNGAYNNHFYEEDEEFPKCQLYGQQSWNGDAYIIGNRTALQELRDALDTALKNGESRISAEPSDGEIYDLYIKCVQNEHELDTLELPYHDRDCYNPDSRTNLPPNKAFTKFKTIIRR